MGSCTRRHFLLTICFFQLITIIERQVFDFLGFMWAPILVNFFHIIFVIFGFFGVYQYRAKYIVTYGVWNVLWIGWNVFLVCFYLSVGVLDKSSVFLNLGSVSWFEANGYGCQPVYSENLSEVWPVRPERVENCLLDYDIIELIHSGTQLVLSAFALIGGLFIAKMFYDEDDRFDFMGGDAKSPQHTVVHPMYVSYSCIPSSANGTLSPKHNHNSHYTSTNTTSNYNFTKPNLYLDDPKTASPTSYNNYSNNFNINNHHTTFVSSSEPYDPNLNRTNANLGRAIASLGDGDHHHQPQVITNRPNYVDRPDIRYTELPTTTSTADDDAYLNDYNDRYNGNALADGDLSEPDVHFHKNALYNNNRNIYANNLHARHLATQPAQAPPPPKRSVSNVAPPPPDTRFSIDKYQMPVAYPYVTRSPNLNRSGSSSRRRLDQQHAASSSQRLPGNAHFVDKIRDAPPGYVATHSGSIQRTKSQDRLGHRRQSSGAQRNGGRPRSYCDRIAVRPDAFVESAEREE